MAERAAGWVDRVFPRVGVRQWVLTVPWSRRWLLARRPELARGVLRIALDAVERWYRKKAGRKEARGGSITVLQRFGSALNLNLHFHALVLDGTFVPTRRGGVSFRRATPTTTDIEALVAEIADRCEA